jgi:hypothetical protein
MKKSYRESVKIRKVNWIGHILRENYIL